MFHLKIRNQGTEKITHFLQKQVALRWHRVIFKQCKFIACSLTHNHTYLYRIHCDSIFNPLQNSLILSSFPVIIFLVFWHPSCPFLSILSTFHCKGHYFQSTFMLRAERDKQNQSTGIRFLLNKSILKKSNKLQNF